MSKGTLALSPGNLLGKEVIHEKGIKFIKGRIIFIHQPNHELSDYQVVQWFNLGTSDFDFIVYQQNKSIQRKLIVMDERGRVFAFYEDEMKLIGEQA